MCQQNHSNLVNMMARINQNHHKKCIISLAKRSKTIKRGKTTILQLPIEILSKILANVPSEHYRGVRATCKQLSETSDYHVRHRFLRALHLSDAEKSAEVNTACDSFILKLGKGLLKVIHQATLPYVESGMQSLFTACFLMLCDRRSMKGSFYLTNASKLKIFLRKFYEEADNMCSYEYSRRLFLTTLLGFLNRKDLAIQKDPIVNENNEIELSYTMNGFWFGLLFADKKNRTLEYLSDKNALLCLLSEILFSVLEDYCFRKTHKFGNKVFVYGRDGIDSSRKKIPQTIWKITVAADQQLINILQSKPDTTLLKGLTASSFLEVKVVIKCSEAHKWGCWPDHSFKC